MDESGSDKRSAIRRYEYYLKGKPAVSEKPLVRGKRFSAIGAICIDGLLMYTSPLKV